jgi:disulfide bond formation protein DsbB
MELPLDRVRWPLIALLASAAMLATAHGFEYFANLAPCHLCYIQRQVYWAAGGIAMIAIFANWRGAPPQMMSMLCFLLGAAFLTGAGVASYHALVEWKILPSPGCEFQPLKIHGDLWDQLGKRQKVPSCDEAGWRMLGLSMACWNAIVSVILAGTSVVAALRPMQTDTANETQPIETLA